MKIGSIGYIISFEFIRASFERFTINIKGDIDVKNLEKFLNQKGIAILLGDQNIILKFFGEIEVRAYGLKDLIEIDYSINNFKDLVK